MGRADDGDSQVRVAAACCDAPSAEVTDAIPTLADEDCIILLGRLLRIQPGLAGAARDALEMIDHSRARHGGRASRIDRAATRRLCPALAFGTNVRADRWILTHG
jgi:hypothetical protein